MALTTTVVGSFPKPAYLPTPDWFKGPCDAAKYRMVHENTTDLEELQAHALKEVIKEQEDVGIDVISDGEVYRDNYVHHFCRSLQGVDDINCEYTVYRGGACDGNLPVIVGKVSLKSPQCAGEWRRAQALSKHDVKMTIPGPMTIIGTTVNKFYSDVSELNEDLIECIRQEVLGLAAAGCKYIQIDEPMLVRQPQNALKHGIHNLTKCFQGVGGDVTKIVHLCCGYPMHLDDINYEKADKQAYIKIAPVLDEAGFDAISLEDAHRHNDLELFSLFKKTTIILGVVTIANSKIETQEEICERVRQVVSCIPADRLRLAPDCGLGYLPIDILKSKLHNLVQASKQLRHELFKQDQAD